MARNHSTWHVTDVNVPILLAFVAMVLAACHRTPAGTSTDGAQIYRDVCAACHGADGKPDDTMKARLNVRDLTSAELRARITPALVEAQVRDGSQNKLMPAFGGALTDAQIAAVAAYVASPAFLER